MPQPTICILDSGVGGLSVLVEIAKLIGSANFVYCADKEYFPYGGLSDSIIIDRVTMLADKLSKLHTIDLMVVACNTASTIVLPELRNRLSFPIVGVVPALKPAALTTSSKKIALLSTEATATREYTNDLIREFCSSVEVLKVGSNRLVEVAEDKLLGIAPSLPEIESILKPILESKNIDRLVLACTHFPFLRDELAQIIPKSIEMIDSGEAVAKQVRKLLGEISILGKKDQQKPRVVFTSTVPVATYKEIVGYFQHAVVIELTNLPP